MARRSGRSVHFIGSECDNQNISDIHSSGHEVLLYRVNIYVSHVIYLSFNLKNIILC